MADHFKFSCDHNVDSKRVSTGLYAKNAEFYAVALEAAIITSKMQASIKLKTKVPAMLLTIAVVSGCASWATTDKI